MSSTFGSVAVEQQHEKLRRFVDEWRGGVLSKLEQHDGNFLRKAGYDVGDINRDPIHLTAEAEEGAVLLDLTDTGNLAFSKVITVLAYDCLEIERMRKEAIVTIFPRLVVFGIGASLEEFCLEGMLQISLAKSFLFFHQLLGFLSELRATLRNLVLQLQGLYGGDQSKSYASFWTVHLLTAVFALADGFGILVTIDHIVAQNGAVGHSLSLFTRMLHDIRSDPSKFGMEAKNVELVDRAVLEIGEMLTTGLFEMCVQEDFNSADKPNAQFVEELCLCLREAILQVLSRLDLLKERPSDREQMGGLLAAFVFYAWINVEGPDKKLAKLIFEVQRRVPILYLFCNIRMVPSEFLMAQLPPRAFASSFLRELKNEAGALSINFLSSLDDVLFRDVKSLHSAVTNWLVSFDSAASAKVLQVAVSAVLGMRFKQLAQGIYLANRLRHILCACVDLHVFMEVPISKDQIRVLRHAAELLKAVEDMYHRKNSESVQSVGHMVQLAQTQMLTYLIPLKRQLEADVAADVAAKSKSSGLSFLSRSLIRSGKETDVKLLDALAAVTLAVNSLQGCCSDTRRILFRLALDVLISNNRLSDEVFRELSDLFLLMEIAADIHQLIGTVTDCSFLYWSREMIPTCFAMVYAQAEEARHLQFLINSFSDGVKLLKVGKVDHQVIEAFEKEVEASVTDEIILPLCRDIETDLRLHVHSAHLKGSVTVNPTKTGVRDLSWFLQLKPLRLSSKYVHIKARVESYLNAAFYDHAAVALHDWKTYGEMRQLSEQKYKLELDDIHLPGQTLEQGVDLLDIMRNIHLFVACYTYNLTTQVFFERVSNAQHRKHLNTVSVRHVANSIRTHGTGIMSTTVNFTYQYLAQKFLVFSQFLFDDHIKSCLGKERRFYKDTTDKQSKDYPFSRAEKLNKDVRKLGMTEDRMSFLDQFRQLIAEMGNALGFVRMVRHGGLHYCSVASGFVQGLGHDVSFEEASRDFGLSEETVQAGKLLDKALESQNLSLGRTNYLNILANVFSKELCSEDNIHLRDFFLIVPALIVNAVEAMLQAKDKLYKRGRDAVDAMFTDDGFALGLAYVLKVLAQDKQFDSLHWFESAKQHLLSEKTRMEDGLDINNTRGGMSALEVWSKKLASISVEQAQNMQLIIKRLKIYLTEFELLEFTFSGARIFFQ